MDYHKFPSFLLVILVMSLVILRSGRFSGDLSPEVGIFQCVGAEGGFALNQQKPHLLGDPKNTKPLGGW